EYLTSILAGGRHLRKLVDDLLDLAKVDAGHLALDLTKVSVADDIPEVAGVVQALAQQKNITLTVEVKEPLPSITADRMRVQQMIYNLLSNAIKFTDAGGHVTVTADTISSVGPTGSCLLRIRVADTGIGIKAEDLARIFDKFERGDSSSAREQEGTGLGLALTRNLVELHGGQISVESEGIKGRGSMFTILLPTTPPEHVPEQFRRKARLDRRGPQPRDGLQRGLFGGALRPAGPQPRDGLQRARRRSGRHRRCRQPLVHPVDVGAVEARHVVRRRQRLGVEEVRKLVVLLGEAGAAVELVFHAQRVPPERLEEVLGEAGAVSGVDGVDEEL